MPRHHNTGEFPTAEDRRVRKPDLGMLFRRLKTGEILGWLALLAFMLKAIGIQMLTSGDGVAAVSAQVVVVKHSVDSLGGRVGAIEDRVVEAGRNAQTSVYLSCEVLKAVTKNIVLPTECR